MNDKLIKDVEKQIEIHKEDIANGNRMFPGDIVVQELTKQLNLFERILTELKK